MRRIAIGLVFLLGACADPSQDPVRSVSWNEHRSLGDAARDARYVDDIDLGRVEWNTSARALSSSSPQIPVLPDPAALDRSRLGEFTPAETKSLTANASNLKALTEEASRVLRLTPDDAARLGGADRVTFPADWEW